MEQITLRQLLQYFDFSPDCRELLQIVMPERDWDDVNEIYADSELLEPFYEYFVTAMSCETSIHGGNPILRVSIEPEINNISTLNKRGDVSAGMAGMAA